MRRIVVLLAAAALLAGCGSGSEPTGRELTVFAAASLTETFNALEKRFEAENSGVDVKFNYAGSSALAQQINEGARADVFASADQNNLKKVMDAGNTDGPEAVFATNRLTIAVAPGNPQGIRTLADLTREGLTVVVCAPQVPCGAATNKVETASGVDLKPASEEQDVKAVLTKVQAGEADAGLVYVTDVKSAGDKIAGVDFPESSSAVNNYPIAVVKEAPQAELAQKFTEYVLGPIGRDELARAGFGTP